MMLEQSLATLLLLAVLQDVRVPGPAPAQI
jgi:hypothetical protein